MMPHDETMILETPFYSRCLAASEINLWEDWKGYRSAEAYTSVEQEYFAVRSNTGVFDISPMSVKLLLIESLTPSGVITMAR